MTSTCIPELGQPEIAVNLAALGLELSSLSLDKLPRKEQIYLVAVEFQETEAHRKVLEAGAAVLDNGLAAAGFHRQIGFDYNCTAAINSGRYAALLTSKWRHPECNVPFRVTLQLSISLRDWNLGHARVHVNMADDKKVFGSNDACGVLCGTAFLEGIELAQAEEFETVRDWKAHIAEACQALTLTTMQPLLDQALVHLEKATTP